MCVLGDGALTGGVAFEALNNIGHCARRSSSSSTTTRCRSGPTSAPCSSTSTGCASIPTLTRLREDIERGVAAHPRHRREGLRPRQGRQGVDEGADQPRHALRGDGLRLPRRHRRARHQGACARPSARRSRRGGPVLVHVHDHQGQGLRAGRGEARDVPRHRAVPPRQRRAQGGRRGDVVHRRLRRRARQARRAGRARRRDHRGHDPGHGPRALRGALSRPLLRRRHRRGARRRLRRRPRPRRAAPGRRRLLDLPAARLRHARPGRRPAAAARSSSPSTAPASSATTARRTTAPSTSRTCGSSRT